MLWSLGYVSLGYLHERDRKIFPLSSKAMWLTPKIKTNIYCYTSSVPMPEDINSECHGMTSPPRESNLNQRAYTLSDPEIEIPEEL